MPQLEFVPSAYSEIEVQGNQASESIIALRSQDDGNVAFDFTFEAIKPNLFRTTFSSKTHPLPPYPSASVPETPDFQSSGIQIEVRDINDKRKTIQIGDITATVDWKYAPVVSLSFSNSEKAIHSDVKFRSYVVDGQGVANYTVHDRNALHVGLGEKRAPMDLTGRFFSISATDCFGYEVYHTDPMYKHMPFLVKATPEGCVAIFSTSHSRGSWSVGSEIDGLWGHFKIYRQDYGGLEQYLITGRTLQDVVRTYAELVGFPILAPRWAYGYLSGGYKYTMGDDPPACQQILEFIDKLKRHDIPCSAHQMSSGYSISEVEPKVRNVFTWNKHRFPNPAGWTSNCHEQGIKLLANIKPFVLVSHPDYKYLADAGGLFTDSRTGKVAVMRLWSAGGGDSGAGSHIDFTCEKAYVWWRDNVRKLRLQGINAMWNDNNEYTLPNDEWMMALEGSLCSNDRGAKNHVGVWGRALQTELMAKASYEGLIAAEPGVRPFVLTRSASVGTLRYAASSWSGDNITSWEGMKGANALSLNAGISLMHCYGHDIGGFEGPQPSPELLLRWVQLGIYSSRFAINCFKTSPTDNSVGEVIEPWMYPEITPKIRTAIKRRYELMPYIYSLAIEGHLTAIPPQRWIGWGFEHDPEVWTTKLKAGEDQYWFGDALLVGGVYEPDISIARIYLPLPARKTDLGVGYINLNHPYEHFTAGQWVTISSPWQESIPVLARIGASIPVGRPLQTQIPGDTHPACPSLEQDNYRGIEIFPPKGLSSSQGYSSVFYDDDGISLDAKISKWSVWYTSTTDRVVVEITAHEDNEWQPLWQEIEIILPQGDVRPVFDRRNTPLVAAGDRADDGRSRYVYPLQ